MSVAKHRLPPAEFHGRELFGRTVKSFSVGEWCPTPDGSGKPEAVAISIKLMTGEDLVMRIKTPERVDEVIQMLLRHKRSVWPDAR